MGDFADLLAGNQEQPRVATPSEGGTFADLLGNGQIEQDSRLGLSVNHGRTMGAPKAMRVLKVKSRYGQLPDDLIERNLDQLEAEAAKADFDPAKFRQTSPIVAKWWAESPINAAVSYEDAKNLGQLENYLTRPSILWPKQQARLEAEAAADGKRRAKLYFQQIEQSGQFTTYTPEQMEQKFTAAALKKLQAEEDFIAGKEPVGFFETVGKRARENPAFLVPFAASISDAGEALELYHAAKAMESGEANDEQREVVMRFARLNAAAERRGQNFGAKVAEVLTMLPAFGGELAATGGLGAVAKGGAQKLGLEAVEGVLKRAAEKVTTKGALGASLKYAAEAPSGLAKAAAQTATAGAARIVEGTAERMTPGSEVVVGEDGSVTVQIQSGTGETFPVAVSKATVDQFAEVASEISGGAFQFVDEPVSKLLFKRWMSKNPSEAALFVSRVTKAARLEGVPAEIIEERVGDAMRAVAGLQPFSDIVPTGEQLAVEAVSFGVPGAVQVPLSYVGQRKAEVRQAQQGAEALLQAGQVVAQMKMTQEAPEATNTLLQQMRENSPYPYRYLDPKVFTEYFEGQKDEEGRAVDPRAVAAEVMGDDGRAYADAIQNGHELEIPVDRYLLTLGSSKHAGFFANEVRQEADASNAREAAELQAALDAEVQAAQGQEPPLDGAAQVGEMVKQMLLSTGEDSARADAQAKLWEARYRARFERRGEAGLTAVEMLKRKPLRIKRDGVDLSFDTDAFEAAATEEKAQAEMAFEAEAERALVDAGGLTPITDAVRGLGGLDVEALKAEGNRAELQDMTDMFKPGGMTADRMVEALRELSDLMQAKGIDTPGALFEALRTEQQSREQFIYERGEGRGLGRKEGEAAYARVRRKLGKKKLNQPAKDVANNSTRGNIIPDALPTPEEWEAIKARLAELEGDLTEERRLRRTSALTGLPNLLAFEEDQAADPAQSIVAFDLDNFKAFNSLLGHEAVDKAVLPDIGKALAQVAVDHGIKIYHRSGDEFAVRVHGDRGQAARFMYQVKKVLDSLALEVEGYNENTQQQAMWRINGIDLTHGIGESYATADAEAGARKKHQRERGRLQDLRNQHGVPRNFEALGPEGDGGAQEREGASGAADEVDRSERARIGRAAKKAVRLDQGPRSLVWTGHTAEDFSERKDAQANEVVRQFEAGRKRVNWSVVKADQLSVVWKSFAKYGEVRDADALDKIAESVLNGIARLQFANEISAHEMIDPAEALEAAGHDFTEEQIEKLQEFLVDKKGSWFVSDYGLPQLMKLYPEILHADTPEAKLVAIDRALNIVHQRNDLAAMFVEGGSGTLLKLSLDGVSFNQPAQQAPAFYSKLVKLVDDKMPAKASADQVRGLTKEISAEEKKWLGLDEFLKDRQTVSKPELLEFLSANMLDVKEVVKGGELEALVEERYQEKLSRFREDLAREPSAREDRQMHADANNEIADENDGTEETKFADYQLPGGENYREVLFTVPTKHPVDEPARLARLREIDERFMDPEEISERDYLAKKEKAGTLEKSGGMEFRSSHWDEPNVLAHVRLNDRTDADGKRVLFVEEIQSDWHQMGRKEGYKTALTAEQKSRQAKIKAEISAINDKWGGYDGLTEAAFGEKVDPAALKDAIRKQELQREDKAIEEAAAGAVPDAPFRKTWHEYAFKRIVRMAAEGGYDRVAWTTGEQQAARYDLSKQVRSIDWTGSKDGVKTVSIEPNAGNTIEFKVTPDGMTTSISGGISGNEFAGKRLDEVVGKDVAEKIMGARDGSLSGGGLRVGGEGMKGFYDKILVDYAGKFGKKFGAKVGETDVAERSKKFSAAKKGERWVIELPDGKTWGSFSSSQEAVENYKREFAPDALPVHSLTLTPALREAALGDGFSLFQDPRRGKDARGKIDISAEDRLITLGRNADASTFLHESWHAWFFEFAEDAEYVAGLAERTPVQQKLLDDFNALLKHVGAKDWTSMTEAQQEQLAKWGEHYLMEGKAPSADLRAVMQRFRAWMVSTYRSMLAMLQGKQPLNDEVRGILDRMLATDEQIAAAQAELEASPLPGLESEPAYIQALAEARESAETELTTKVMAEWARERAAWWKEERQKLVGEYIARRGKERVYKALSFLQHGKLPDGSPLPEGTPTFKLDKDSLTAAQQIDLGGVRPYVYTTTGGVDAEVAAEMMGFGSADEMVRQLVEAKPLKALAAEYADEEMKVRHGDMLMDGTMAEEAKKAVHNDKRAALLRMEFKFLAEQRPAALKGLVRKVAARVPNQDAVRAQAEAAIARLIVKDIRPITYQRAENKARREAVDLLLKGDVEGAMAAKNREMLNHELYRAAQAAREDVDALVEYMRKFQKPKVRERMGKAGGDYLEQLDALAERYSFQTMSGKAVERRQTLREFLAKMEAEGTPMDIPEALVNEARTLSYKEASYEELVGLRDTVKQIEHLASLKNKLLKASRMRELDAALDEATASIEANSKGARPKEVETRLPQDELLRAGAGFLASHRKMASLARQMDGYKDGGMMWDLLVRPVNEAGDAEASKNAEATKALKAIFDVYSVTDIAKMYKKEYIPGAQVSLTKMGQLMVALNWGNEDNRTKLMEGYGWNQAQVQAILDRLDERDWKVVQAIWDHIDSYWPETEAMAKRVKGVAPAKVEPAEVVTKYGTLKGGYFPLKYDDRQEPRAYAHLAEEAAKRAMGAGTVRATTKQGHRKARVEGVKMPVRLDFGVIFEHVGEVIHDQTHYETLIDMNKLLGSRRLQSAIITHYGDQVYRQLTGAMNDIAAGHVPAQQSMERGINWLRAGTTIAGMGWNLWTSLLQPMGLTQSAVRIGPKWMAKGLSRVLGDAARMENTAAWVYEKSAFMRNRGTTQQREIAEVRNQLRLRGKLAPVEDSYFWLITRGQLIADLPTWAGAYEKAQADAETDADVKAMTPEAQEARAVALADQAVLDSQGGGQVKDLAQIQRGGPLLKLWTNFYSYFNTTYNLAAESAGQTNWKKPASVGRFAVDMLMLYTVPALLGLLMRDALKGGGDDEDDWMERAIREQVAYLLGSLVLVREVGSAVQGFRGYEGPAGARGFAEIGRLVKQVEQGEIDEAMLRSMNNVAGIVFHYPAGQVDRSVRGTTAMLDGQAGPLAPLLGPAPKR